LDNFDGRQCPEIEQGGLGVSRWQYILSKGVDYCCTQLKTIKARVGRGQVLVFDSERINELESKMIHMGRISNTIRVFIMI